MSKKDYIAMAKILNEIRWRQDVSVEAFEKLLNMVCSMFEEDNPSFDKDRFVNAVYRGTKEV